MISEPVLTHRTEHGRDVPLLLWRLPGPVRAVSSAVLGGGVGPCGWVINASVPMSYDRDDPADHLRDIAAGLGLSGPGVGLLTGVDVADLVTADDGGVRLWATVGLGAPIQAADRARRDIPAADGRRPHAGTVNVVAWVPQRLTDGALVNAVATVTEAKTQAIRELGLAATGTATDAVAVLCPSSGPAADYAGPRAPWGARLARAAHRAVRDGGAVDLAGALSWSDRQARRDSAGGPVVDRPGA